VNLRSILFFGVTALEVRNLVTNHPGRVQTLSAQYDQWAERCQVRPWELTKIKEK